MNWRKSRKNMRKSRKTRKSRKSARRNRKQRGGNSMTDSLKQGITYMTNAPMFKGGAAPLSSGFDVLPAQLRGSAMIAGQDAAYAAIAGMQDGGRRRRRHRKAHRKTHRKSTKRSSSRKNRKSAKRSRKQRGGAAELASVSQPTMILPSDLEKMAGLHPQWKLAGTGGI